MARQVEGRRGARRWLAKRVVVPVVLLGAVLLVVAATRTWVTGTVDDPVLGTSSIAASGSDVARSVFAVAFLGAASVLVAATAGRVARVVAGIAMVLAGGLGVAAILLLAADPGAALGQTAAELTGRTGTVPARGHLTVWPWLAVPGAVLVGAGGIAVLAGRRSWSGLSSRYDAPVSPTGAVSGGDTDTGGEDGRGAPDGGGDSAWDRLSRGEDPT